VTGKRLFLFYSRPAKFAPNWLIADPVYRLKRTPLASVTTADPQTGVRRRLPKKGHFDRLSPLRELFRRMPPDPSRPWFLAMVGLDKSNRLEPILPM
jgi:hypothetical protein